MDRPRFGGAFFKGAIAPELFGQICGEGYNLLAVFSLNFARGGELWFSSFYSRLFPDRLF